LSSILILENRAPSAHSSILTIRVCTDHPGILPERTILFGEGAVRKATAEFLAHYHAERNHQALENALLGPDPGHAVIQGKVHRRERLGGLLNYYYRKAA
jgi:hypothetical protein